MSAAEDWQQALVSPRFITGIGKFDTHAETLSSGKPNPRAEAGQPYETIGSQEIVEMAKSPPSVPKDSARWFIPSTYCECDGRDHSVQRERGRFEWLTLDIDHHMERADLDDALHDVVGPARRVIYSSRSSTEAVKKWRALVRLASPIAGPDYADTANAFYDLIEEATGGTVIPDRGLSRPAQPVYLPNKGEFYDHSIGYGERLDLTDHPIIARREANRARQAEAEATAKADRERRAAARKASSWGESDSVVDAFNAKHDLGALLDRYGFVQMGGSDRWRSPYQTTRGGFATYTFPGGRWVSYSNSDAANGLGRESRGGHRAGDAFDLFCHFEHGGSFHEAVKAYGKEVNPPEAATVGGYSWGPSDDAEPGPQPDGAEPEPGDTWADEDPHDEPEAPAAAPDPRRRAPDWVKNSRGKPAWCAENAGIVLEYNPLWKTALAYNELTQMTMLLQPIPGSHARRSDFQPRELRDDDFTTALRWFNRNGFPDASRNTLIDAMLANARENVISPVKHYLEALEWDGQPRLERWLTTYVGAEDTRLNRATGRAWAISAVARALRPGCKADCALILEGSQGVGKSTVLRTLAGEEWFFDGLRDMTSKDASSGLRGKWIIELPELSAMRRSDVESVKAFLSRDVERFRPAYGRNEVTEPRRVVFAGTTNSSEWLTDDTGGRRFWPVKVGTIDIPALARDRDQLWAEAVAAYRDGAKWWLSGELERLAAAEVSLRAESDPWDAAALHYVEGLTEVSPGDVLEHVGILRPDMTKALSMRVAGILTRAGWTRQGRFTSGPNRNLARYVRPT